MDGLDTIVTDFTCPCEWMNIADAAAKSVSTVDPGPRSLACSSYVSPFTFKIMRKTRHRVSDLLTRISLRRYLPVRLNLHTYDAAELLFSATSLVVRINRVEHTQ